MPTDLPGGKILAGTGGYINVVNPYNGTMTRLDVAWWENEITPSVFRRGHSGTMGAKCARWIINDYSVKGRVWWDAGNPPENLLMSNWGCGLQLGISSYAEQNALGITQQKFYLIPDAILSYYKMRDSSEGHEDDIVTADFTVVCNSQQFLMPDMAGQYAEYSAAMGAIGQYSALGTFTTMQ
jgi:hypothetical protein